VLFTGENQFDSEIAAAIARWQPAYGIVIPTWLVKAIIARESSFKLSPAMTNEPNVRDVSHGLMRVRGQTARDLGFTGPIEDLHKPGPGILYGVKYLAQQIKRYPGDYARAAAAYNAGPGNVKPGGSIPNPTYVDKVLGFARYFQEVARAAAPAAAVLAALALGYLLIARRRRAA
jgi:soluble lytic murein transglycosylase-like protein